MSDYPLSDHQGLLSARVASEDIKDNFRLIMCVGEKIVKGAELPPLGQQEMEIMVKDSNSPNRLSKGTPQSGAPS